MPAITLPDGSVRQLRRAVTGTTVAAAIGPGLAKAALAMEVDGSCATCRTRSLPDAPALHHPARPEALELIRHDAAHVLAEAVQELFPGTQVTIGPPIENGFYYDFHRNQPFTPDDFAAIEAGCARSSRAGAPFRRRVVDREEAIALSSARARASRWS
jgi:threonyl-tRNA synthetase